MPKASLNKKPARTVAKDKARLVAHNLRRLIDASPDGSVNAFAARTKGGAGELNQSTLRRILIGEMSPTELQTMKIAEAAHVEPWQMLHPAGPSAVASQLTPEAMEIAQWLDELSGWERDRALALCRLALSSPPPRPQQGGDGAASR